jgi:hypothetical protein
MIFYICYRKLIKVHWSETDELTIGTGELKVYPWNLIQ